MLRRRYEIGSALRGTEHAQLQQNFAMVLFLSGERGPGRGAALDDSAIFRLDHVAVSVPWPVCCQSAAMQCIAQHKPSSMQTCCCAESCMLLNCISRALVPLAYFLCLARACERCSLRLTFTRKRGSH